MKTFTTKQNNRRKLPATHDHSTCAPCAGCGRTLPRRHYGMTFCATCEKRLAGKPMTPPVRPADWRPWHKKAVAR